MDFWTQNVWVGVNFFNNAPDSSYRQYCLRVSIPVCELRMNRAIFILAQNPFQVFTTLVLCRTRVCVQEAMMKDAPLLSQKPVIWQCHL